MPAVKTDDGVKISYTTIGKGPKDILFIHCWGNSSAAYREVLRDFDVDGLRLIVPDRRGTGASDAPPSGYTTERFAMDMMSVLEDARSTRPMLVGHSAGGQISMFMASKWPEQVSGQILLMPVPPSGAPLDEGTTKLLRDSSGNREAQATIFKFGSPLFKQEALDWMLDDAGKIGVAATQQGFDAWTQASFAPQVAKTRCPTLVLANDDPFYSPETQKKLTASIIPGARLAYLPDCGHYAVAERPKEIAAVIQGFVAALR